MQLIKQIIEQTRLIEDAAGGATGAGGVAGFAMPLFVSLSSRDLPKKIRVVRSPYAKPKSTPKQKGLALKESFYSLFNEDQSQISGDTFDSAEVVSKLKSLQNKETTDYSETQAFALEDEDGNLVKVRVRLEQAQNFEAALNAMLADVDDDNGLQRKLPEIAELLFKLKDSFDIVDVEWPKVIEDENEDVTLGVQGQELGGAEGAEGDKNAEGAGLDLDLEGGLDVNATGGGDGDVKGLLTQVIDMMKADAEARKAEAHARAAEAKAKEADTATKEVYARVKREEQILDMEAQEKKAKDGEKEAKRLAQLSRWKRDMEQEDGATFDDDVGLNKLDDVRGGREEEETHRRPDSLKAQPGIKKPRLSGRVAPHDVAKFILTRAGK
jgi:hypothetical protein